MLVYCKPSDDAYRSTYIMLRHENQIKSFSRNGVDICNFEVEIHNILLLRLLEEMTILIYLS